MNDKRLVEYGCQYLAKRKYGTMNFSLKQVFNKYEAESEGKWMTRFNMFTDDELDAMESAFCNEGLTYLVDEIRRERERRIMWMEIR